MITLTGFGRVNLPRDGRGTIVKCQRWQLEEVMIELRIVEGVGGVSQEEMAKRTRSMSSFIYRPRYRACRRTLAGKGWGDR